MKRCFRFVLICLALLAGTAFAQGLQRPVPKDVVLGRMTVTLPPEITIDGKPDRLAPGSRIRDLNNMVVLSATLAGKTIPVVYRRDAAGLVNDVWQLTDREYAKLSDAAGGSDAVQRLAALLGQIFNGRQGVRR